jgi:endonuclease YncB( thermonuclease family)
VQQATRLRMRRIALLGALVLCVPGKVHADQVVGRATVVDGDTLGIGGQKIRLHGIDAPESSQRCTRPNGKEWRCGQQAANALSEKIGHRNIRCEGQKRDRWGRLIAVCFLGEQDLNAWLVRRGWAVAYRRYSKDYITQEDRARRAKVGVWSGTFEMPWDWRKAERSKD